MSSDSHRVHGLTGQLVATMVALPQDLWMEFVWIEPGTFVMGATQETERVMRQKHPDGDREWWFGFWFGDEQPAQPVRISSGFWLGRYPVTQSQWTAVMGTEPWFGEEHVKEGPGYPAVCVTWHEAQELAFRLGRHAGEPGFRLPTEAEWEYACRAGTDTLWCFGDEDAELDEHAWYDLNTGPARQRHARPVGQKLRNPWGLHDMHGNVAEWCQDWYQEEGKDEADYVGYYGHAPEVDPMGPSAGTGRVVRGGSWRTGFLGTHSASRTCAAPQERGPDIGVRLVRSAGGRR